MRNIRELTLLFDGKLGGGLKGATAETSRRLETINRRMKALSAAKLDVGKFRTLKAGVAASEGELAKAQANVARLAREIRGTESPSKKLTREFEQAKTAAGKLRDKLDADRASLEGLRRSLHGAGVSTTDLGEGVKRLDRELALADNEANALRKNLSRLQGAQRGAAAGAREHGAANRAGVLGLAKWALGAAGAYIALDKLREGYSGSVQEAEEGIRANTRLATLMRNVKGTTQAQINLTRSYSAALSKRTSYEDDAVISGASQLATFQLQSKSVRKLMPSLIDLTAGINGVNAGQQEYIQAGNIVGKMLIGNVGAAARFGISMTDAQKKLIKTGSESVRVATITRVIQQNFGGLAASLANTPEGRVARLRARFADMREEIGRRLLPYQTRAMGYLVSKLPQIEGLLGRVLNGMDRFVGGVVRVYNAGVRALNWYQQHLSGLTPIILGVVGALSAWRLAVLAQATVTRLLASEQMKANIAMLASPTTWLVVGIGALIGVIYLLVKHWDKVKAGARAAYDWMQRHRVLVTILSPVLGLILLIARNWDKVKASAAVAWDGIKRAVQPVWEMLKRIWELIQRIIRGARDMGTRAAQVLQGASKPKTLGGAITRNVVRSALPLPLQLGAKVAGYAKGGIVTRPQLAMVGEAGPEAVVPLSRSGLLDGLSFGGVNITFAPLMNVSANADRNEVRAGLSVAYDEFKRNLDRYFRDERRRSMA